MHAKPKVRTDEAYHRSRDGSEKQLRAPWHPQAHDGSLAAGIATQRQEECEVCSAQILVESQPSYPFQIVEV